MNFVYACERDSEELNIDICIYLEMSHCVHSKKIYFYN